MAKFLHALDDRLSAFIREQKMFFTATAPNDGRETMDMAGKAAIPMSILRRKGDCKP